MTPELPAGLAEPLHILEPAAEGSVLPWLLALALVAAFLVWWRWWWARRKAPEKPPLVIQMSQVSQVSGRGTGILGRIGQIRDRYQRRYDRRQGCHELSSVLREHLEPRLPVMVSSPGPAGADVWRRRPPLETLTAQEIASFMGDDPLGRFLVHLAGHQFGRTEPDRETFTALCDLATEVVQQTLDDLS